jgi:hypothetical protein
MLRLTLDSNCFPISRPGEDDIVCLDALLELQKQGSVTLSLAPKTRDEIINTLHYKRTDEEKKKVQRIVSDYIEKMKVIEIQWSEEEFEDVVIRAKRIHSPNRNADFSKPEEFSERCNKIYADPEIFAYHVLSGGNFFVTNDKDFLEREESFEKQFHTKIRALGMEFIRELHDLLKR